MHVTPSARLVVAGREEKEATLHRFMVEFVQAVRDGKAEAAGAWTILVRNLESPAARALAKAATEPEFAGITIRAIVLETELSASDLTGSSLVDGECCELRSLRDPRLVAAHEQLVLGPSSVWIGDCMRRDPVKRDAFQMFHATNAAAARHSATSFERLWAKAAPVKPVGNPLVPGLVAASQAGAKAASWPASNR